MSVQKVLIVGGVAGGASTAARLRRLDEAAEIILFERGEYISFANCGLPYYVGEIIKDREKLLVQSEKGMEDRFAIDVRPFNEVITINRAQKTVIVKDHKTGQDYTESYDKLVLSPGASPIIPDFGPAAGEGIFTMRNMADVDKIKAFVDGSKPKSAVVIGAGFVGVEIAENLRERGINVYLIEVYEHIMKIFDKEMAKPLEAELAANGIEILTNEKVVKIAAVGAASGYSVEMESCGTFNSDMIVYALGVRPETGLAQVAGLEIGALGGIRVDEHMRTSDPDIYAVGDAVEVRNLTTGSWQRIPLAGPANKQGRIAADNIAGRGSMFNGSQATAVLKVFGLTAAYTGCNETLLQQAGIDYLKSYTISGSHAGYYPGAHPITLKLLFAPDGKILGAQAFGRDGVDKRIDVLAMAIRNGLTVYDLEEFEHAYAPPFSSAKDPVNMAGFVAANILKGDVKIVHWNEIDALAADKAYFLLDVRTPIEFSLGAIKGAVNIQVDDLRSKMSEIPKDKKILLYCRVGLRGYIAARLLMQYGYDVYNLSGGYEVYANGKSGKAECIRLDEEMMKVESCGLDDKSGGCQFGRDAKPVTVLKIDACGLSCPGPIMKLNEAVAGLADAQVVEVHATDPAFAVDSAAWCKKTGNTVLSSENKGGEYIVRVMKGCNDCAPAQQIGNSAAKTDAKTMVVFSGDFDKAMASFIIANGAAAMGSKVTMFFTFWGLNVLRRHENVKVKKNLVETMFGMMMPRGANRLQLSKMNMGGMGLTMIKQVMRGKNVMSLNKLISEAQKAGVRLIACQMSMDLMGIKQEEMIDGVEIGGVAAYLGEADQANVNLFI